MIKRLFELVVKTVIKYKMLRAVYKARKNRDI